MRFGTVGYLRCLLEVYRLSGKARVEDVQRVLNTSRRQALYAANWLEAASLIHVCGWESYKSPSGHCTFWSPVFAPGPGAPAPHPNGVKKRATQRKLPVAVHAIVALLDLLKDGPRTKSKLAADLGSDWKQTDKLMDPLIEAKLVYISGWQVKSNSATGGPEYEWGPGKANVPKPKPNTNQVNWARGNAKAAARRHHLRLLAATAGPLRQAA